MIAAHHRFFRTTLVFVLLGALGICAGCKSYQLGHPAELPFETIYIRPAKNDSFAPQAQALVSSRVREAIIRDGRVQLLADPEAADTVLTLTLTDYTRRATARRQDDTEVAENFDLTLQLQIDLYDQRNGTYLFEGRELDARTTGYTNNPYAPAAEQQTQSLIQSEYNAMAQLARDLGQRAANELLSVW
jgi:hypothetical protein